MNNDHIPTMKLPLCTLAMIMLTWGCISDNSGGPIREDSGEAGASGLNIEAGEETPDQAGESDTEAGELSAGDQAGDQAGEVTRAGDTVAGEVSAGDTIEEDMGVIEPEADMDLLPPDPPPAPEDLPACDRFCQRMEDCLYPRCEALSDIPVNQFCRGWCRSTGDEWLDQGANLSCEDFTRRIYGFSPEIRTLCEADPDVDNCEVICEFGEVCGLVSDECLANCASAPENSTLCFRSAADTGDCQRFLGCYDQGPPQRDPEEAYEETCLAICEREAQCISNACAPGTWGSAEVTQCASSCVDERASQEELIARFQRTCDDIVNDTLVSDADLAARCDVGEDEVCPLFCTDRVVGCGALTQEECEAACGGWDEANFICLQEAGSCGEVEGCLVTLDEQARCRRSCDHLEGCLEAACPPRIIPPNLADTCTADCFADPITLGDLEDWEETECREVREVIYQDNPQLRPICEGNRDFRPTPEECAAFCDDSLDACIIGGPTVCLSACASLTREQYACALEAQGACEVIDLCLSEAP